MDKTQTIKELTLKEIFLQINSWLKYLISKWLYILICIAVGLVIGFGMSKFSKPRFKANSNFVLENVGSSGMGDLGSAFGLSGNSNAGLFTSLDNIIWLYNSDELLTKTLLSPVMEGENEGELLINIFTKTSKKLQNIIEDYPEYKNIYFNLKDTSDFNPTQIKYLRACISVLKSDNLTVKKVEKTDNIVSVLVEADNEVFAYSFNKNLVQNVNTFYVESKTKKRKENVDKLQLKVDTLKAAIDRNMYEVAETTDQNPFPNPHLKVLNVEPQKQNIDVQVLSNLYIQATQNLELAKNELSKETPIIQLVDEPILPLPTKKMGMKTGMTYGGILGFILPLLFFIGRKIYIDAMNSDKSTNEIASA